MSKSFVMDDEHWITINGNHVLINGEGEVQSGMGGALKGVKLSKATSSMKGGKFSKPKEEYKKAKSEIREASKKADELRKKSFDRRKADIDKIDKQEEEVEKKYENIWAYGHSYGRLKHLNPEKYAKLMERVKKKGKALEKERKAERDKLDNARQQVHEREDGRLESIRSTAEKNYETASNKMVKAYQKNREAKNALASARGKLKTAREANAYMKQRGTKISPLAKGGKGRFSNIDKEYDEADKRYNEKVNQGNEKVRQAFNERDEKVKKLNVEHNNFEDKNRKRRMALRSAERRLQKLDGGTGKYNRLIKRVENERDKNYSESDKQSNAYANKRLAAENAAWEVSNKNSEQRAKDFDTLLKEHKKARRKEKVAKEVLSKARPKIAERRQAIRKYNEKNSQ